MTTPLTLNSRWAALPKDLPPKSTTHAYVIAVGDDVQDLMARRLSKPDLDELKKNQDEKLKKAAPTRETVEGGCGLV